MTYEVDWALKANYLLTCSLTTNFNLCHLTEKPFFLMLFTVEETKSLKIS